MVGGVVVLFILIFHSFWKTLILTNTVEMLILSLLVRVQDKTNTRVYVYNTRVLVKITWVKELWVFSQSPRGKCQRNLYHYHKVIQVFILNLAWKINRLVETKSCRQLRPERSGSTCTGIYYCMILTYIYITLYVLYY